MTNSRKARIRRQRQRRALLTMALVLVTAFACIGGTIAWLTATTGAVTNTFTVGDINIVLKEHAYNPTTGALTTDEVTEEGENGEYKMVPGTTLDKDPFVRVLSGSEKCYVFVEVVEQNELDTFISYAVDSDNWTLVGTGKNGGEVYRYNTVVDALSADSDNLYVLEDNAVTVKNTVEKSDMTGVTADNEPKLVFYGYAVQSENLTLDEAWNQIKPTNP